jgi:biopolymer transport protein ExbD
MQFYLPTTSHRSTSLAPLASVALLPVLFILVLVCFSLSQEQDMVRLPTSTLPRPPAVREAPVISVRLSRQGIVMLAGQQIADGGLAAAWQRELAALRLLGYEASQATVVVRADLDLPTADVQQLIETAQAAGFTRCVLRPGEPPPVPRSGGSKISQIGPASGETGIRTRLSHLREA